MKLTFPQLAARQRAAEELPGVRATARVDRRAQNLLPRLRPGDIAVIDHLDLDRASAAALAEARVAAVVNAAPMISGRFPNLGPALLVEAGIPVVDGIGADALAAVRDGSTVRLHGRDLFAGEQLVASGRVVDAGIVEVEMERARAGMGTQMASFVHNTTELLRREEVLLLHGQGLPVLRTRLNGRPVVVVAPAPGLEQQLATVTRFAREQDAVLVGVQRGADALLAAGLRPDVVVVDGGADAGETPSAKALRAATDVVVRVDHGGRVRAPEPVERSGVRSQQVVSALSPEDVALLVADAAGASVLVGVGMQTTIEEFLDRQRPGLAGTYLTRLKVGSRLVDAAALPPLYSGRVRAWHLFVVLLVGLVALAAAIAVTPVGRQWLDDAEPLLRTLLDDLQGLFS